MKMYFQSGDLCCYPLSYHKRFMVENQLSELRLFEAKRETGTDMFYCEKYEEVGYKGVGSCGKICRGYKPRNKKSGACRHLGTLYEQTDKIKILKA